jgi:hypothetical protein
VIVAYFYSFRADKMGVRKYLETICSWTPGMWRWLEKVDICFCVLSFRNYYFLRIFVILLLPSFSLFLTFPSLHIFSFCYLFFTISSFFVEYYIFVIELTSHVLVFLGGEVNIISLYYVRGIEVIFEIFLIRNFQSVNSFITSLCSWFLNLCNEVYLFCDFSKDSLRWNSWYCSFYWDKCYTSH